MSLQYQYTLDMEKERGQMALLQFYDLRGGHSSNYINSLRSPLSQDNPLLNLYIYMLSLVEKSEKVSELGGSNPLFDIKVALRLPIQG